MNENMHSVYFLGIGGIGMSAIARYFILKGIPVAGYDRVKTPLSLQLEAEGMDIHHVDNPAMIPGGFNDAGKTLVIVTPAIPSSNKELTHFRNMGFKIIKRSVALGEIVSAGRCIAIAGTHGKTTISGMLAHVLHESGKGCNAFLGGISVNYGSNYIFNSGSDIYVTEADEFDRSFLTLFPDIALITAMDADHLDIYGDYGKMRESFSQFASQVKKGGTLIIKNGIEIEKPEGIRIIRYSLDDKTDYYAFNIKRNGLTYSFSIQTPMAVFHDVCTGIPGRINIENSVAAFALAMEAGVEPEKVKRSIATYKGIKRRFEIVVNKDDLVYIDDYAHHPEELRAFISSVREIFPGKNISGVFQPHLFSRTRDLASGFAESLSLLDDVILLDIYPAREEPLPGISSQIIFRELKNKGKRVLCSIESLLDEIDKLKIEVFLSMGAGDIDKMEDPIKKQLISRAE